MHKRTHGRLTIAFFAAGLTIYSPQLLAQPALVGESLDTLAGSTGNTITFDFLGTGSGAIAAQAEFAMPPELTVTEMVCSIPGCAANPATGRIAMLSLSELQDHTDAVVITFDVASGAAGGVYTVEVTGELYTNLLAENLSPNGTVDGSVDVSRIPIARDDQLTAREDGGPMTVSLVQDNGSGADELGDPPYTVTLVGSTTKGTLVLDDPNGLVTYTPNPNETGMDMAGYTITDSDNETSDLGMITINIDPAPDPRDDLLVLDSEGMIVDANVIVDNGAGADDTGDGLGVVSLTLSPAEADAFELRNDGGVDYVPGPSFPGTDTFAYRITDANGDEGPSANVLVVLAPVFRDSFE
ncbi:MAG: Ig-like domain-containing protein [Pseudomonadota bacterium]